MSPDAIAAVGREAVMALLLVSAPAMIAALVVGILVSLFQALTSIQEATLTFVPKLILVFVVILVTMPFMASQMQQLTEDLFARMITDTPEGAPGAAE